MAAGILPLGIHTDEGSEPEFELDPNQPAGVQLQGIGGGTTGTAWLEVSPDGGTTWVRTAWSVTPADLLTPGNLDSQEFAPAEVWGTHVRAAFVGPFDGFLVVYLIVGRPARA